MSDIKVSDQVYIVVKRSELIAKVIKIEESIATCSFFMPRSKGMSILKFPISELRKVEVKEKKQ